MEREVFWLTCRKFAWDMQKMEFRPKRNSIPIYIILGNARTRKRKFYIAHA